MSMCVCVWGGGPKNPSLHKCNASIKRGRFHMISVKNGSRSIKSNRCKAGKVKKSIDLQRKRSGDGRSERCEVESQPCCFSGNHCLLHNCCPLLCTVWATLLYNQLPPLFDICLCKPQKLGLAGANWASNALQLPLLALERADSWVSVVSACQASSCATSPLNISQVPLEAFIRCKRIDASDARQSQRPT